MEVLQFTPKSFSMIQNTINSQTYFFTINHITKETYNKHIYGLRVNNENYFLSKTSGIGDGEQLDANPLLNPDVLHEINDVLTEIELKFKKRPPLELINQEIFNILIKHRNPGTPPFNRNAA